MWFRTRERETWGKTGHYQMIALKRPPTPNVIVVDDYFTPRLSKEHMEDVVNNRGFQNDSSYHDNPCFKSSWSKVGGIVNGYMEQSGYRVSYENWFMSGIDNINAATMGHLAIAGEPSNVEVASAIASRTNPSRPSINLPLSIAELRDIPKMVERKVSKLGRGNSVIEHTFGWAPILRDIRTLSSIVGNIDKNIESLNALSRGPVTRSRSAWSGFASNLNTDTWEVNYTARGSVRAHKRLTTTRASKRVAIHWTPNFDISTISEKEKWKLAARISMGVEPTMLWSTLYELVPWSWFADWFTNLGDLVSLTNNSVASIAGPPVVSTIRETKLEVSDYTYSRPGPIAATPCVITRRDWTRSLVDLDLSFQWPILSIDQMSILVNLANRNG